MKIFNRGGFISFVVGAILLVAMLALGITTEKPMGSVSGSVRMQENGMALPGAAIIVTPIVQDEDMPKGRVLYSDKSGAFHFLNLPAGDYKIEASARVHSLDPTTITVKEGLTTTIDLELEPGDPNFRLYSSQRVFMPDEKAEVEAHGFGEDTNVAVKIYKIDLSKFLDKGSIYGVLYSISGSVYNEGPKKDPTTVGTLVSSFNHKVQNADAEGTFMDAIDLQKLKEGFYWVQCSYGQLQSGTFLNISSLALVTKSSPGKLLSFVTDLKTGKPVSDVQLSYNDNNAWTPFAKTDKDGLANFSLPGKGRKMLVLASQGGSQAVSAFYLYGAADTPSDSYEGDEGNTGGPPPSTTTVFAYTDRPIYRPGDLIQFKGFARKRIGSQYNLPGAGKVAKVEIRSEDNTLLDSLNLPMDANGSFHGSYQTDSEDSPGQYNISIDSLGQQKDVYFTLAAYRKPEFTIKVTWSQPHYTMGEKLRATVHCEYYFGGPVAGAKVSASLFRNQDWYSEYESDEYDVAGDDGYYGAGGGDYVDEGESTTDGNGDAVFEFTPKPEEHKDYEMDYTPNYVYSLNADVTEAGDKYFSGSGSVKVSQGSVNLRVEPDNYIVAPGGDANVTISTLKVEDNSPSPGQKVDITYGTEEWSRRTDSSIGWQSIFTATGHESVTTDADGKAHLKIPAHNNGSITIKASMHDELGNEIKQNGWIYVGTDDFEPPPTAPDLAITLDKKLYTQGDTAKILITAAKPGLSALLTVEGEDVMHTEVVRMDKQSAVVNLPVSKDYLPRVTISVVAVQNKKFLETSTPLRVDVAARKLQLSLTSDKPKYLPGETATYTIHAAGPDGKPVPTDLSLGVVDEAIYALQEDNTDPVKEFYPARPDLVSTNYSFPELYLDGGDKGGDIPVRINFKDTAAWIPSVKTDANGSASVQVKLPDNLTKWRATLIGVSDATDVGIARQYVQVSKPLMIRLQGPKFMVSGDHQQVAAVITNDSEFTSVINVSLEMNGFSTRDSRSQAIRIESGKSDSISWDVTATKTGKGSLVAKAWIDGGPSDGVNQDIAIKSHARKVDMQNAGDIHGSTKFTISRRQDADPEVGRMKVSVTPTLGTTIYDSLDTLIDYPYGCVEQTMSRFMPAIVVAGSLKQVGILRPDLEKKLPGITSQSLAKLMSMQHPEGGWGWWAYDTTDPFMTAYVLDGLKRAKNAGFDVDPNMTDRALDWASKAVVSADATKWNTRDRLYLEYALALYGKKDVAGKALKAEKSVNSSAPRLAVAAMTANLLGPDYVAMRDNWMAELRQMAIQDAATAHWPEPSYGGNYWWWDYDDVYGAELTALPLQALEAISPDDPLIEKGVRHLIMSRNGDIWWSTRDTSFACMAIAWYLKREPVPSAKSSVHVLVNGTEVGKLDMDIHNLRGLSPSLTVPVSKLNLGANEVELRTDGSPLAYYSLDYQQFAVADTLGKVINGSDFKIDRSYHLLESQKMEDGTYKLMESPNPVTTFKSGDVIQCDLVINTSHDRTYMMVTDPIPSNCHPEVDTDIDPYSWDYWYSEQEVYDDRVTFFSRTLPTGEHKLSYVLRAESPGVVRALPPTVLNMYNPTDRVSDAETVIEVRR